MSVLAGREIPPLLLFLWFLPFFPHHVKFFGGSFSFSEWMRTEDVVSCTDCKAPCGRFVLLGYINKIDIAILLLWFGPAKATFGPLPNSSWVALITSGKLPNTGVARSRFHCAYSLRKSRIHCSLHMPSNIDTMLIVLHIAVISVSVFPLGWSCSSRVEILFVHVVCLNIKP